MRMVLARSISATFLVFFCIFSAQVALAQSTPETKIEDPHEIIHVRWNVTLPAQNGQIGTSMVFTLKRRCYDSTQDFLNTVGKYYWRFASGYEKKVKELQKEYQEKILKSKIDGCYHEVVTAGFLMAAITGYGSQNTDRTQDFFHLLQRLYRQDLIFAITDEMKKFSPFNSTNVIGGYSCKNQKIWIDPSISFMNQGTILFHELEHWARDRMLAYAHKNNKIPEFYKSMTAKEKYLTDEVMSALFAAAFQIKLRYDVNRKDPKTLSKKRVEFYADLNGIGWHRNKRYFKLSSDLNLYSPEGNLIQLWRSEVKNVGVDPAETHWGFLKNHFFEPNFSKTSNFQENKNTAFKIVEMVEKVYFDGSVDASEKVLETLKNNLTDEAAPYLSSLDWLIDHRELWDEILSEKGENPYCEDGLKRGGEGVALDDSSIKACLKPLAEM